MNNEKLIFGSLADAKDYSKRKFNGLNTIRELESNKYIYGSSSPSAMRNPILYVVKSDIVKTPSVEKTEKIKDHKFTRTLTGFDQL